MSNVIKLINTIDEIKSDLKQLDDLSILELEDLSEQTYNLSKLCDKLIEYKKLFVKVKI
jgi:hypothetical protein